MNVANNWAFWIGLIGALAVLYVLPTLIGVLRHVESLALVVNAAWGAIQSQPRRG
jgi:hypothetical protein